MLASAQDNKMCNHSVSSCNADNETTSAIPLPRWKQDDVLVRISRITWIAMNVFMVTVREYHGKVSVELSSVSIPRGIHNVRLNKCVLSLLEYINSESRHKFLRQDHYHNFPTEGYGDVIFSRKRAHNATLQQTVLEISQYAEAAHNANKMSYPLEECEFEWVSLQEELLKCGAASIIRPSAIRMEELINAEGKGAQTSSSSLPLLLETKSEQESKETISQLSFTQEPVHDAKTSSKHNSTQMENRCIASHLAELYMRERSLEFCVRATCQVREVLRGDVYRVTWLSIDTPRSHRSQSHTIDITLESLPSLLVLMSVTCYDESTQTGHAALRWAQQELIERQMCVFIHSVGHHDRDVALNTQTIQYEQLAHVRGTAYVIRPRQHHNNKQSIIKTSSLEETYNENDKNKSCLSTHYNYCYYGYYYHGDVYDHYDSVCSSNADSSSSNNNEVVEKCDVGAMLIENKWGYLRRSIDPNAPRSINFLNVCQLISEQVEKEWTSGGNVQCVDKNNVTDMKISENKPMSSEMECPDKLLTQMSNAIASEMCTKWKLCTSPSLLKLAVQLASFNGALWCQSAISQIKQEKEELLQYDRMAKMYNNNERYDEINLPVNNEQLNCEKKINISNTEMSSGLLSFTWQHYMWCGDIHHDPTQEPICYVYRPLRTLISLQELTLKWSLLRGYVNKIDVYTVHDAKKVNNRFSSTHMPTYFLVLQMMIVMSEKEWTYIINQTNLYNKDKLQQDATLSKTNGQELFTTSTSGALINSNFNAKKRKRTDGMIWFDPPRNEDEVYKRELTVTVRYLENNQHRVVNMNTKTNNSNNNNNTVNSKMLMEHNVSLQSPAHRLRVCISSYRSEEFSLTHHHQMKKNFTYNTVDNDTMEYSAQLIFASALKQLKKKKPVTASTSNNNNSSSTSAITQIVFVVDVIVEKSNDGETFTLECTDEAIYCLSENDGISQKDSAMLITSASTYNRNNTNTAATTINTPNQKWRTNEADMCDDNDDDNIEQIDDDDKCTTSETNGNNAKESDNLPSSTTAVEVSSSASEPPLYYKSIVHLYFPLPINFSVNRTVDSNDTDDEKHTRKKEQKCNSENEMCARQIKQRIINEFTEKLCYRDVLFLPCGVAAIHGKYGLTGEMMYSAEDGNNTLSKVDESYSVINHHNNNQREIDTNNNSAKKWEENVKFVSSLIDEICAKYQCNIYNNVNDKETMSEICVPNTHNYREVQQFYYSNYSKGKEECVTNDALEYGMEKAKTSSAHDERESDNLFKPSIDSDKCHSRNSEDSVHDKNLQQQIVGKHTHEEKRHTLSWFYKIGNCALFADVYDSTYHFPRLRSLSATKCNNAAHTNTNSFLITEFTPLFIFAPFPRQLVGGGPKLFRRVVEGSESNRYNEASIDWAFMRLPVLQLPNILTADFNNLPDAVGNVEHALFHHVLTANEQRIDYDSNKKESCKIDEVTDDDATIVMDSSVSKEATQITQIKPDIYANEPTFANLLAFLCLIQCPLKSTSANTNTFKMADITTTSSLSNVQETCMNTLLHKMERSCAITSRQIASRQRFTATLYRFAIRSNSSSSSKHQNSSNDDDDDDEYDSSTNDDKENENDESNNDMESSTIEQAQDKQQQHKENTKTSEKNEENVENELNAKIENDDCLWSGQCKNYKLFLGKGKTSMNVALANIALPNYLDITIQNTNNIRDGDSHVNRCGSCVAAINELVISEKDENDNNGHINFIKTVERTYYTDVYDGWRSVLTYPLSIGDIRPLIMSSALNIFTINETDNESGKVHDAEVVPMSCRKFLPSSSSCEFSLFDSTHDRSKPVLYHPMEWLHVIGDPLVVRDEPCAKTLVDVKQQKRCSDVTNCANHSLRKEEESIQDCESSSIERGTSTDDVDNDHHVDHNVVEMSDIMTRKYVAVKYTPLRLPLTSRRLYKPFSYGQISRYHIYELQSSNHRSASDVIEYFSLLLRQPRVHRTQQKEEKGKDSNMTNVITNGNVEDNGWVKNDKCSSSRFADGILHFYGTALEPLFIHYVPRRALRFQLAFISPIIRKFVIRDYSELSYTSSDDGNKKYSMNGHSFMNSKCIDHNSDHTESMTERQEESNKPENKEANSQGKVEYEEQTCKTENEYFCTLCDCARHILTTIDEHVTESVSRIYLQLSAYILSDEWKEPVLEIKVYPIDDALILRDGVDAKNDDVGVDSGVENSNNNCNMYSNAFMLRDGELELPDVWSKTKVRKYPHRPFAPAEVIWGNRTANMSTYTLRVTYCQERQTFQLNWQ